MIEPRNDPRYVPSDDPRAVLKACGCGTWDMGGWTDDDEDAFIEAVEDEYRFNHGEDLDDITIETIEYWWPPEELDPDGVHYDYEGVCFLAKHWGGGDVHKRPDGDIDVTIDGTVYRFHKREAGGDQ